MCEKGSRVLSHGMIRQAPGRAANLWLCICVCAFLDVFTCLYLEFVQRKGETFNAQLEVMMQSSPPWGAQMRGRRQLAFSWDSIFTLSDKVNLSLSPSLPLSLIQTL